jgi:hypothetical protein
LKQRLRLQCARIDIFRVIQQSSRNKTNSEYTNKIRYNGYIVSSISFFHQCSRLYLLCWQCRFPLCWSILGWSAKQWDHIKPFRLLCKLPILHRIQFFVDHLIIRNSYIWLPMLSIRRVIQAVVAMPSVNARLEVMDMVVHIIAVPIKIIVIVLHGILHRSWWPFYWQSARCRHNKFCLAKASHVSLSMEWLENNSFAFIFYSECIFVTVLFEFFLSTWN